MEIQWYPGHMTKARRQMQEDIKLIDLMIEIIDARIPYSSRNPEIDKLAQGKSRMILMNKADLADPKITEQWLSYYKEQGIYGVALDARRRDSKKAVARMLDQAVEEKRKRDAKRGLKNRPVRAMVAGIPNVGKSTFINSFSGKASTKTGNKPGVTKGKQWIHLKEHIDLLDTPGILWPKFEDQTVGLHLAAVGSINDQILPVEELAMEVLSMLIAIRPECITERFGVSVKENRGEMLVDIAIARNFLKKGSEPDTEKAAAVILDEFRKGTLGRFTLESPGKE